ncbi:STAS domain-containing protein [Saccharothrix sp. HUAS TT1]|uniref:STAS domain-containing protein n=1 Tax=unclassified Saccharothrix TaxID=2593673 RepID=UPI00345BC50D
MDEQPTRHTTTELDDGVVRLSVSGTLDAATHRPVLTELDTVFETGPAGVVLDLRAVDFMGSVGIAMLVNARHRANRLRIPLAIVADSRPVLRPLQMSQVDGALPLHPTVDAALAAIRVAAP